jgi:hypothetical protein
LGGYPAAVAMVIAMQIGMTIVIALGWKRYNP